MTLFLRAATLLGVFLLPWLVDSPRAQEEASAFTRPFLWRIEGDVPSWLFGTMHLPDPRVTELPKSVEEAFARADAFYGEIELDTEAMRVVSKASQLPPGQTLKEVVPEETYARLRGWANDHRVPMPMFERMRPWAVAVQLPLMTKLRELTGGQPLDMVLFSRARDADKEVGGIETVEEQIGVFDAFSAEEQAKLLDEAITQLEEAEAAGEDLLEKIVVLYLAGDLAGILEMMDHDETGDPELQERFEKLLLWDRNERMVERIAGKLRANPERSYFFAVGAAHYASARGIVALLREEGFEIRRLDAAGEPVEEAEDTLAEDLAQLTAEFERLERTLLEAERLLREVEDPDGSLRRAVDEVRAKVDALRIELERVRRKADEAATPRRKAG